MSDNVLINRKKLLAMQLLTVSSLATAAFFYFGSTTQSVTEKSVKPTPIAQIVGHVSTTAKMSEAEALKHLKSIIPNLPLGNDDVIHHARVGMFQFAIQGVVFYLTDDGTAIIKGDVFDSAMMNHDPSRGNLTEQFERAMAFSRKELNERPGADFEFVNHNNPDEVKSKISTLPIDNAIYFPAADGNAPLDTFTVFYDLGCKACSLFYPEIGDLQKMGYAVNVVLVSPNGKHVPAFPHSKQMLCQANPATEFNLYVKKGFTGFARAGCEVSIDPNHEVYTSLALKGTPSIVRWSDGKIFQGLYYSAELAGQ